MGREINKDFPVPKYKPKDSVIVFLGGEWGDKYAMGKVVGGHCNTSWTYLVRYFVLHEKVYRYEWFDEKEINLLPQTNEK